MSDVFGLAGFLRDDDLVCHDGPLGRMAGSKGPDAPIDNRTYREHDWAVRSSTWSRAVAQVAYFVALPFVAADDGIAAGEPTECFNPVAAVRRAEALSRQEGHVGAVAFSRTGNPATGDFSDARVIRKFGDVPDDLSAL